MARPPHDPSPVELPEDRVEVIRLTVSPGPFTVNPLPWPLLPHLFGQPDGSTLLILSRPAPRSTLRTRIGRMLRRRLTPLFRGASG